jgi:hypothetical protein
MNVSLQKKRHTYPSSSAAVAFVVVVVCHLNSLSYHVVVVVVVRNGYNSIKKIVNNTNVNLYKKGHTYGPDDASCIVWTVVAHGHRCPTLVIVIC